MAGGGKEEKGSLDHFLSTQTCVHVGNNSQIYEHDHDIHRKLKSKNWEIGSVWVWVPEITYCTPTSFFHLAIIFYIRVAPPALYISPSFRASFE